MADRNDAADERQHEPREGLEGEGFDAGTGAGNVGRDTDGRGSANADTGTPRAPDEQAVNDAFEGRGSSAGGQGGGHGRRIARGRADRPRRDRPAGHERGEPAGAGR
jgi:hypothetical protein